MKRSDSPPVEILTAQSARSDAEPAEIVDAVLVDEAVIDVDHAAPAGEECPACGCPVEQTDRFCPACGTPNESFRGPAERDTEETLKQKHFKCSSCGSEISADLDQRSYVCPFCDSTYVVEFSPDYSGRQRPEFVIGFTLTPQDALDKFKAWIKQNNWFRPGDLGTAAIADKLKGVYLPFWSFSMLAESQWHAEIGEHWYRTETYTTTDSNGKRVTRTRQVQETEWWPLQGRHHQYHSGYLISGSKRISQVEADSIKPFQLPALKRYEAFYLAGWLAEEYSVERDEALEVCRQEFLRREQQMVAAFLPGDTYRQLSTQTEFSQMQSDLCLLPVYLTTYNYQGQLFRFMVNGQTGRVAGQKPISTTRIGIAIGAGVAAVGFLILIVWLLSRLA